MEPGSVYCTTKKVPAQWYEYVVYGWWQHVIYHVIAAVLVLLGCLILAALLYGITRVFYYVAGWEWYDEEDEDPCKDPKCPCQRHVVERQRAEEAQRLATTVAIAAATSAIVSSGS